MAQLDPTIPLRAIAQQQPIDLIGPFAKGMQLKNLATEQDIRELQLEEATRQQTERGQMRDVARRHVESETFGGEQYLKDVAAISPEAYQQQAKAQADMQKAQLDFAKSLATLRKTELDTQSAALKQASDVTGYIIGQISATKDQASYENNKAMLKERLRKLGVDTAPIDQLPEIYDPKALNDLKIQNLSVKDQLDEAWRQTEVQRKVAEQQALMPGRVEEAQKTEAATQPFKLERARQAGAIGAEKQARGMVEAARIERSEKPLTGAEAKAVGDLNSALEMTYDIDSLFKPEFVGQLSGRAGAVREFTGAISDDEVQFRRVVEEVKDRLLRAQSGAQINEAEYNRLSKLVPNVTDQPNVFQSKLRGFQRSLQQLREEKLRVATTGRGEMREESGAIEVRPQPQQKVMSEDDVTDAMQQTGWSREDVLDAARKRGYQVPGQ